MPPLESVALAPWSAGARVPGPSGRRVNAPALLLALGVTGWFLFLLTLSPARRGVSAPSPHPASVMLELLPAWAAPAQAPPTASRRGAQRPAARALLSPAPSGVPPGASPVPELPPSVPSHAEASAQAPLTAQAVEVPASAPLRLDGLVLRRAALDGAGTTPAQMAARQAGRSVPESPQQALGSAMARSARPDCISPNEGGSLLLLPKLALDALAGRCK
jgi:hypothetical protein